MSDSLPEIALRFCRECLGWDDAIIRTDDGQTFIDRTMGMSWLYPGDIASILSMAQRFLGTRYWIQINRGLNSDWKWMVSIGMQNQQEKGACREQAIAINDDLAHAMLEACVKAVALGAVP